MFLNAYELTLAVVLAPLAVPSAGMTGDEFRDSAFRRGFVVSATEVTAEPIALGTLQCGAQEGAPVWRLAQWGSRHPLEPRVVSAASCETWSAGNEAKRIGISYDGAAVPSVSLEVKGSVEYDGRMREHGQAWPHLLIEQRLKPPVAPAALEGLRFALEMRIRHCEAAGWAANRLEPRLHTAQVSAFFTVHGKPEDTDGRRDMIWFGIPLFDARHPIPPGHQAIDQGQPNASGKFICVLDGTRFWDGPTGNGEWHKLDVNLLPLLREALGMSQAHGHLTGAALGDLELSSFNLGWEVPGPYDAALEIRGLSLEAHERHPSQE